MRCSFHLVYEWRSVNLSSVLELTKIIVHTTRRPRAFLSDLEQTSTFSTALASYRCSLTGLLCTWCISAVSMHFLGILALLALAAAELKQLAYVFGMAVIFSFLLSALCATVGMAVFTFRSDDVLTEPHYLYYASIWLQTLGLGFLGACSLHMASKGDVAIDAVATVASVAP